ncbi:MAG TPA: hypothetical protein VEF76_00875 [Patescibacteria group bacterium]|nr:hypothetical protein [Patescibacteria group bacterium]
MQGNSARGIYLTPEKPLSLESVDSDLFSAILSGEVEFVRSRFRGSDRTSDAEAVLMIRARRAEEEKAYSKHIAAEAYAQSQEDPAKSKAGYSFFGGMSYAAYMQNMSRPESGTPEGDRDRDLFGGFLLGGQYVDAYGGKYDAYGYQYSNGNYKTVAGDLFDMAKGTITLASSGAVIALAPALATEGANVLRISSAIADEIERAFADQEKAAKPASLAGKIIGAAADAINPVANALEVGAPTAPYTSTPTDLVAGAASAIAPVAGANAEMAMATASNVAAFAVASTGVSKSIGDAFAADESFRAAASFEEGGALNRMEKHAPLKEHHIHLGERYLWRHMNAGMTGAKAAELTHEEKKELHAAVKAHVAQHTGGVVTSLLQNPLMAVNATTAIRQAKEAFDRGDADFLRGIAGKAVGAPEAGSCALNLGKKPAFKI